MYFNCSCKPVLNFSWG